MKRLLMEAYRTHPKMAVFRNKQVELHYHYQNITGATIAEIMASPTDV